MDSDVPLEAADEQSFVSEGGVVFKWPNDCALEDAIFRCASGLLIEALLDYPPRVLNRLGDRSMNNDWGDLASKGFELFPISKKDRALSFIENDRDLQAQLYAIRGALKRNKKAEEKVMEQVHNMDKEIRSYHHNNDDPNEHHMMHMDDFRADLLQGSVYSDAAHSMSAVGMLAPFIESLFVALFEALRKTEEPDSLADPRRQAFQNLFWNPQLVIKQGEVRNDLVRGIQELAKFVGLEAFLPKGYDKTLTALFAYRNNMFHNGFEWPQDKRKSSKAGCKISIGQKHGFNIHPKTTSHGFII